MKFAVFLPLLFLFNFAFLCYGHNSNRIWNGVSVSQEKYPNIVEVFAKVYVQGEGILDSLCTGTIISSRHVLTAAHCVTYYRSVVNETAISPGFIMIYKNYIPHVFKNVFLKGYDYNDIRKDDIAIIEFNENLPYTPVLLAKNYVEGDKDIGTNFGFGGTGPNLKKDSESLMKVNMFISKECDASNEKHHFICAGNSTHRSDHGDSGGPLFVTSESQMYQVGLVYGGAYENGTGTSKNSETSLFTRLSAYCDLIEETTKGAAKCHEVGKAEAPLEPLPPIMPSTRKHIIWTLSPRTIRIIPNATSTTSTETMLSSTETTALKPDNNKDVNEAMSKDIFVILLTVFIVKILY